METGIGKQQQYIKATTIIYSNYIIIIGALYIILPTYNYMAYTRLFFPEAEVDTTLSILFLHCFRNFVTLKLEDIK